MILPEVLVCEDDTKRGQMLSGAPSIVTTTLTVVPLGGRL